MGQNEVLMACGDGFSALTMSLMLEEGRKGRTVLLMA